MKVTEMTAAIGAVVVVIALFWTIALTWPKALSTVATAVLVSVNAAPTTLYQSLFLLIAVVAACMVALALAKRSAQ